MAQTTAAGGAMDAGFRPPEWAANDRFLDCGGVAAVLAAMGISVAARTLRQWAKDGRIPMSRDFTGRDYRIRESALRRWIEQREREAEENAETKADGDARQDTAPARRGKGANKGTRR